MKQKNGGAQSRDSKAFSRARVHDGEAAARTGHGKHRTKSAASTRTPKDTYSFDFVSTMGHASQERVRCSECPIKWQMVGCARIRARSESPSHRERLNHHDSVVFGKALIDLFLGFQDRFQDTFRTCGIPMRIVRNRCPVDDLSRTSFSLDNLFPDTLTQGCRTAWDVRQCSQ